MLTIAIHAMGMPFNGNTIPMGKSLGGSESAAYYLSKELVRRGHKVICFTNDKEGGVVDGVSYEYIGTPTKDFPLGDRFHYMMQVPHDVLIVQRHPLAFANAKFNTKINILWMHDLAMGRNISAINMSLVNMDFVMPVSEWHGKQIHEVYDIPKEFIFPTNNGVDYDLIEKATEGMTVEDKEPRSLFYMARPERGLENLLMPNGIMDKLPDHHLYICAYDNVTAEMKDYYEWLWQRADEMPNVTNLGSLGKEDLYRKMAKAQVYVYPTTFEDTSCIAVMEANGCGLPVVSSRVAALPETMKDKVVSWVHNKKGVDIDKFVRTIRRMTSNKNYSDLSKEAMGKRQTWGQAADSLIDKCYKTLKEKSSNKDRMLKHFERMGDIIPALNYSGIDEIEKSLPHFKSDYGFVIEDRYHDHYKTYYDYERDVKGVEYQPDERIKNEQRYGATLYTLRQWLKDKDGPINILDYGCAHGHYTLNLYKDLCKEYPNIEFIGVDITQSNIDIANEWAKRFGVDKNCHFYQGEYGDIAQYGPYDIVIAEEVIEHVPNPGIVVDTLRKSLATEHSLVVLSVPYGPWEALGMYKDENLGWRAHIHHLERQDIENMWGSQPEFQVINVPVRENLGSYVIKFKSNPDLPTQPIDYERKFDMQAPQETLSLCMIIKNGANSIGQGLDRMLNIADEIVVGVDNTTTDSTRDVLKAYQEKHGRLTFFDIESPLKQGFDEARNRTIEKATCDWILWFDDDEKIVGAENIRKYLRPNAYNGYGIQQHHYSAEPAEKFKTDYPIRLFRNHKGIRFFGVVHEHPETAINKGVGKMIVPTDISIMHTGYEDEATRRKRFERNWPLMQRDRQKYPDRILGRFLWVRDLSHVIRYNYEINGYISPEMKNIAKQGIDMYMDIMKINPRMTIDGLQFYSELVNYYMGERGIEYHINIGSSMLNGGPKLGEPIKGYFMNTDHIREFSGMLEKAELSKYEHKYY
jgi:glycosyltransferase involved in cell wall biosynthesis/2-polyprenyl-3-methyl-5-hydroxy-6-metoxy-1,4-benzoquinol methylase